MRDLWVEKFAGSVRFEKICWVWNYDNTLIEKNALITVKFEDIISQYSEFQKVTHIIGVDISKEKWSFIRHLPGILLQPHRPEWCDARCFLSTIEDRIDAAIILPEVKNYPADQIELISALPIRETLGLGDGQVISIKVFLE